jgi:hypothetical protein
MRESLIVFGITLIFLVISATVGISTNTPPSSPAAEAAYETEHESEGLRLERNPTQHLGEPFVSP